MVTGVFWHPAVKDSLAFLSSTTELQTIVCHSLGGGNAVPINIYLKMIPKAVP